MKQTDEIRRYLIAQACLSPHRLAKFAAVQFGISRQAAHRHIAELVKEGVLIPSGATRGREYRLAKTHQFSKRFQINGDLEEHIVWERHIREHMSDVPKNVDAICHYGFTEILNNVVDHSEGSSVSINFSRTAATVEISITDNGIGIFNKIQRAMGFPDPRLSILELAKGKLTTDPKNHTGEGIFFSSRMFERFAILSGNLWFDHTQPDDDWLIEHRTPKSAGTKVIMITTNSTKLSPKDVFDKYSDPENYTFSKTHVPVSLAQFGDDQLISRSQAKRVLARVDRFHEVLLDFQNVPAIGQAFADEIFRVFANNHPQIKIMPINANQQVTGMISRAKSNNDQAFLPSDESKKTD